MKRDPHFIITGHLVRDICTKSAHDRLVHRLHSVALVFYGLSASEVAKIFDDSPRIVAYWVARFKQRGLAGLEEVTRPGRPSRLNAAQMKKLQRFVAGLDKANRSVNAGVVSAFLINEWNIHLTSRQCWRILKRLRTQVAIRA